MHYIGNRPLSGYITVHNVSETSVENRSCTLYRNFIIFLSAIAIVNDLL